MGDKKEWPSKREGRRQRRLGEGGAWVAGEASETEGTCGWEPGRQAELLLPAQELLCQLDAGGWAQAGLPARHTQSAL